MELPSTVSTRTPPGSDRLIGLVCHPGPRHVPGATLHLPQEGHIKARSATHPQHPAPVKQQLQPYSEHSSKQSKFCEHEAQ